MVRVRSHGDGWGTLLLLLMCRRVFVCVTVKHSLYACLLLSCAHYDLSFTQNSVTLLVTFSGIPSWARAACKQGSSCRCHH